MKILDCTIRDGGYLNNWNFDKGLVKDIYNSLSKANIDIIELGFITPKKYSNGEDIWRFCNDELLNQVIHKKKSKIGGMIDFTKSDINDIPQSNESMIDIIRVATHKNKISNTLDFNEKLKNKGYQTSIQMMGYSTYTYEEQINIVDILEDVNTDYVYIADSYGSLTPKDIKPLLQPLLEIPNIKIGFHPHNNLENAFANTLEAIKCGVNIIDSSVYGMGRCAGNLKTETIVSYLNITEDKYDPNPIIKLIEKYFINMKELYNWGPNTPYMMTGILNCHPYYVKELIDRGYDMNKTWDTLKSIVTLNPIGFDNKVLDRALDGDTINKIDIKDKPYIVALMPMKEHSERIPHKNIRMFNGKPLFYWMLSKLINCKSIDKVVVDTDSDIITNHIKEHFPEATVIQRPEHLIGDKVSMNDIIMHDTSVVEADLYLLTHCTNPLLKIDTLDKAIKTYIMNSNINDSLFGVSTLHKMFWDVDVNPINHNPSKLIRTQDITPLYEENGNIYIFTKKVLDENNRRIGKNPYMFEVPKDESFDIDEMIEFKIAESFHRIRNRI